MSMVIVETPLVFPVAKILRSIGLHLLYPDSGTQIKDMIRITALGIARELKTKEVPRPFGFFRHPTHQEPNEETEYWTDAFIIFHGNIDEIHQADHEKCWVMVVVDEINLEFFSEIAAGLSETFKTDLLVYFLSSSGIDGQPVSDLIHQDSEDILRASYHNVRASEEDEGEEDPSIEDLIAQSASEGDLQDDPDEDDPEGDDD